MTKSTAKVFSIICILLAGFLFYQGVIFLNDGMDKKDNYYNSDYSSVNAYVGGDAYNYITNAGYFSGYSALAGSMFICSAIFLAMSLIIAIKYDVSILKFAIEESVAEKTSSPIEFD